MLKDSVTAKEVCSLLNELLEKDPGFMKNLVTSHYPCNADIAAHATVQVRGFKEYPGIYTCGLVGIINGLFGIRDDGFGAICYEEDENGDIIKFYETPMKGYTL